MMVKEKTRTMIRVQRKVGENIEIHWTISIKLVKLLKYLFLLQIHLQREQRDLLRK